MTNRALLPHPRLLLGWTAAMFAIFGLTACGDGNAVVIDTPVAFEIADATAAEPTATAPSTNPAADDVSRAKAPSEQSAATNEPARQTEAAPIPPAATASPESTPPESTPPEPASPEAALAAPTPTVASAVTQPIPTATPPPPTATPTPPPPTATPTPTPPAVEPEPTPTAVPESLAKVAAPDGDDINSPFVIDLADGVTVAGEVSFGEDEFDYYQFIPDPSRQLESVEVSFGCIEVEIVNDDPEARFRPSLQIRSGNSFSTGAGFVNHCSETEPGKKKREFEPLSESVYVTVQLNTREDQGADGYGRYVVTVTPTYVEYDEAPEDGDSSRNPLRRDQLDPAKQDGLLSGQVSGPDGDQEDWRQFTITEEDEGFETGSAAVTLGVDCSGGFADATTRVVATLYTESGTQLSTTYCDQNGSGGPDSIKLSVGVSYVLQVEMVGTGSIFWEFIAVT